MRLALDIHGQKEPLYLLERLENDHSERITISHHKRIREIRSSNLYILKTIYDQTVCFCTLFARFVSAAASLSVAECITYLASSVKSALSILKSGGLMWCLLPLLRDPYVPSPTSPSSHMITTVLGVLKFDFFLISSYSITVPYDHISDSAHFIRYGVYDARNWVYYLFLEEERYENNAQRTVGNASTAIGNASRIVRHVLRTIGMWQGKQSSIFKSNANKYQVPEGFRSAFQMIFRRGRTRYDELTFSRKSKWFIAAGRWLKKETSSVRLWRSRRYHTSRRLYRSTKVCQWWKLIEEQIDIHDRDLFSNRVQRARFTRKNVVFIDAGFYDNSGHSLNVQYQMHSQIFDSMSVRYDRKTCYEVIIGGFRRTMQEQLRIQCDNFAYKRHVEKNTNQQSFIFGRLIFWFRCLDNCSYRELCPGNRLGYRTLEWLCPQKLCPTYFFT